MIIQRFRNCEGCFKPEKKRLGSLESRDDYECYGESYVKCFWGLCDHQKVAEAFVIKSDGAVVTHQPSRRNDAFNNHSNLNNKF